MKKTENIKQNNGEFKECKISECKQTNRSKMTENFRNINKITSN